MSSKRGKQKETVEEDFEAFVRHQLSSISDDLKEMKGTQVKIQRDIESLQSQTKKNESSISKLKESLDTKLEVLTGQLHEANTRIDQIENDITKYAKEIDDTYERLLSLERYSRDYNLRFYNIPESTGEDWIAKLRDIIENDLQLQTNIENAHSFQFSVFFVDSFPVALFLRATRENYSSMNRRVIIFEVHFRCSEDFDFQFSRLVFFISLSFHFPSQER